MTHVNEENQIWLGLEAPDGLMYTVDQLQADPDLLASCGPLSDCEGGLVFSNFEDQIIAQGPYLRMGDALLGAGLSALREGKPVHHAAYENDSPVDLLPDGDTLIVTDQLEEISILMPLDAAITALAKEADAFVTFTSAHTGT